ncbi:J domain-containing protein [Endozoicomonas acroporae]|uniref:J domain-containing protein n=1 Tax=Endozoicomonas acroporae TaxID=1701104 RepID=UPI001C60D27D|nr:J domain-containing protein [Endozoicomonas acroporae]
MDGMGAGMNGIGGLQSFYLLEGNFQGQEAASGKKFGRKVSKTDPVTKRDLFPKQYCNKKIVGYVIKRVVIQPFYKSGVIYQPASTAILRQQWFSWATHQFQGKGYAPSVARVMAERVLTQCGYDYRSVEIMVNTTPLTPQSAFRELQRQNYQWAMGQFTAKGYRPDRSHEAIVNALNIAGSDLTRFQQWVSDAPHAQSNKNASTLRPWMIEQIEKKGFSPEEAQAVADNLIKESDGNVDYLRQSVGKIRPKGAPRKLSAEQMVQKNRQSLNALGLSEGASLNDVKKAYRKLALRYHPDKNPGNVEESNKTFQIITEANRHLIEDSDLFKGQS